MTCFRVHFRRVHDKFDKLTRAIELPGVSVDMQKYNAIKRDIAVLSEHNIREVEGRIGALGASLVRVR